jgi:hypothetical protein
VNVLVLPNELTGASLNSSEICAAVPLDDLLRGMDPESGDLGEALHRVVVFGEQVGHLLIELVEVIFDHASVSFSSRRYTGCSVGPA